MWPNKKLSTPKDRVTFLLFITKKVRSFTDSLRGEFMMSRADVTMEGFHSLLEKKKYIIECIWAGDYVLAYRTLSTSNITLRRKEKIQQHTMYIYHIEPLSSTRCYIFYKENGDRDDVKFLVMKHKLKNLKKEVEKQFPISVRKEMPDNN